MQNSTTSYENITNRTLPRKSRYCAEFATLTAALERAKFKPFETTVSVESGKMQALDMGLYGDDSAELVQIVPSKTGSSVTLNVGAPEQFYKNTVIKLVLLNKPERVYLFYETKVTSTDRLLFS